jgi:hypothetical protein
MCTDCGIELGEATWSGAVTEVPVPFGHGRFTLLVRQMNYYLTVPVDSNLWAVAACSISRRTSKDLSRLVDGLATKVDRGGPRMPVTSGIQATFRCTYVLALVISRCARCGGMAVMAGPLLAVTGHTDTMADSEPWLLPPMTNYCVVFPAETGNRQ